MKKRKLYAAILSASLLFAAFKVADNIIARLGMQQQAAQRYIMRNFIGRFDSGPMELWTEDGPANSVYKQLQSFQIPTAKFLPAIISGDKEGAAKEMCEYVKRYVNSVEFAQEYTKLREDAMPLEDQGQSLAQMKRNLEIHQININNYKTDTKYVAEQQQQIDNLQKRIDVLMKTAKTNFPGKEAWLKLYPEDPAVVIKARLQEYLQAAATVDFSAKLSGTGRKQTFVNPAYEKKSLKWKAIYRAGKEVNDVVTAFVKEWLKGEIISNEKTKMTDNTAAPAPVAPNAVNKPAANNSLPDTAGKTTAVVKEEQPAQKKSGIKKLKDKLGTIIKN